MFSECDGACGGCYKGFAPSKERGKGTARGRKPQNLPSDKAPALRLSPALVLHCSTSGSVLRRSRNTDCYGLLPRIRSASPQVSVHSRTPWQLEEIQAELEFPHLVLWHPFGKDLSNHPNAHLGSELGEVVDRLQRPGCVAIRYFTASGWALAILLMVGGL